MDPSPPSRRSSTVHLALLVLCSCVIYHIALDTQSPSSLMASPTVTVPPIPTEATNQTEIQMVTDQWLPSRQSDTYSTSVPVRFQNALQPSTKRRTDKGEEPDSKQTSYGFLQMNAEKEQLVVAPSGVSVGMRSQVSQPDSIISSLQPASISETATVQSVSTQGNVAVEMDHAGEQQAGFGKFQQLPPLEPSLVNVVRDHEKYSLLLDVNDDLPFRQGPQIPYFWHIHKSGGSSMKHIMTCLERTQTRRMTLPKCNDKEADLKVCKLEWGSVVNADASSPDGIERIVQLRLVERDFDRFVLDSSRVYEALDALNPRHRGRLFLALRDPVERAISKFYYTKVATWERNYKPDVQNMTMLDYAESNYCYNNWVTRRLVNKTVGDLEPRDLAVAKEILRQKALILLTSNMLDAGERLIKYFGWKATPYQHSCIRKFAIEEPINANPHPIPSKLSPEWEAIRIRNLYDVELFDYAKTLHRHQSGLLNELSARDD